MKTFNILIILLPRDAQFVWNGHKTVVEYHLTLSSYIKNIKEYLDAVKAGQGFGTNLSFRGTSYLGIGSLRC
jgi:hypothetical protein